MKEREGKKLSTISLNEKKKRKESRLEVKFNAVFRYLSSLQVSTVLLLTTCSWREFHTIINKGREMKRSLYRWKRWKGT